MKSVNTQIVFSEKGKINLMSTPMPEPKPGEIVVETECSIVSPGTELACLHAGQAGVQYPFLPGYGSVGKVMKIGAGAEGVHVGQRVFTYGKHAQFALAELLSVPLADNLDPVHAVFARIAAVSITALRVADVALGDSVAVIGLGPVGNIAAQLFELCGCRVIGIDPAPQRRLIASKCGISHVFAPGKEAFEGIKHVTGGKLCRSVVEATGIPAAAAEAISFAGKLGELILLGSPRGEYSTNLTHFLDRSHLWDYGCITIKGAHEWRLPVHENVQGHGRFSVEGNVKCVLDLISLNKLHIVPLLTHVAIPQDAEHLYPALLNEKDAYLGVVFDWRKNGKQIE